LFFAYTKKASASWKDGGTNEMIGFVLTELLLAVKSLVENEPQISHRINVPSLRSLLQEPNARIQRRLAREPLHQKRPKPIQPLRIAKLRTLLVVLKGLNSNLSTHTLPLTFFKS
jgi:hypothetical protein